MSYERLKIRSKLKDLDSRLNRLPTKKEKLVIDVITIFLIVLTLIASFKWW